MSGKGSGRRQGADDRAYREGWDRVFGAESDKRLRGGLDEAQALSGLLDHSEAVAALKIPKARIRRGPWMRLSNGTEIRPLFVEGLGDAAPTEGE